jgi:hypothetical protein
MVDDLVAPAPSGNRLADTTLSAMEQDALASSHPLSSSEKITTLAQIDNYFDDISCEWGRAGGDCNVLHCF